MKKFPKIRMKIPENYKLTKPYAPKQIQIKFEKLIYKKGKTPKNIKSKTLKNKDTKTLYELLII
jgi:hypothetical protein